MKSLASESKPFQSRSKVRAHFPEHMLAGNRAYPIRGALSSNFNSPRSRSFVKGSLQTKALSIYKFIFVQRGCRQK